MTPAPHSLLSLYFNELATARLPERGRICALPMPGLGTHRIGRDSTGCPCIILSVSPAGISARPDLRLRNLSVRRRVTCDITRPDGGGECINGVIVTCLSDSNELSKFFLTFFEKILSELGANPREQDVDACLDHAVRLFAELENTSEREIRGLWGELLLIVSSVAPAVLVRRWHDDPQDLHDFYSSKLALEVKTCKDSERIHHFNLSQIRPNPFINVIVASIPVRPDPRGPSVLDLVAEIDDLLVESALRSRLREVAFRIGGPALTESPQRFDRKAAHAGTRFMRGAAIPAFEEPIPLGVLEAKLKIRCRDVPGEGLEKTIIGELDT